MTFMVHPEHGANNVSESDVEKESKNGWKVSTHGEWMAMAGKAVPDVFPQGNPVVKNKPGRKPKGQQ